VRDPKEVPGIARLGPDALSLGLDGLAEVLKDKNAQIKGVLRDQQIIGGIGNAYSDEILHVAKMSPFARADKLTRPQLEQLHAAMQDVLNDAVNRSVGQKAATLKGEKALGHERARPRRARSVPSAATSCAKCPLRTRVCNTARPADGRKAAR
jgi:formamidopyrimidine-DNA glycosylase